MPKSFRARFSGAMRAYLSNLGLDVRRSSQVVTEARVLRAMLARHPVDIVFDVGANDGGYGRLLRRIGYRGRIVSFEPLSSAHGDLVGSAIGDTEWLIAPRQALGAENGVAQINVAGNSTSSSLLPMLKRHVVASPESAYVATEEVPLSRLDDVAKEYIRDRSYPMLKIDTQGYEYQVLEGAGAVLERTHVVQLELSLVPLYGGQKLLVDLSSYLVSKGFELRGLIPGFPDQQTGELLQVDGLFTR